MTEINFSENTEHIPDIECVNDRHFTPGASINKPLDFRLPLPHATNETLMYAARWETERCGLIDNLWGVQFIDNVHESPVHNFKLDEKGLVDTLARLARENKHVIGIFHTHPGGNPLPSPGDIAGWPNRDLNWRYFIATTFAVYEFDYRNQPLHVDS